MGIEADKLNTTELAFLGDSVYEVYIRKYLLEKGFVGADRLHREAVKYVRAESQAKVIRRFNRDFFTEEEKDFVRRARNKKSVSKSRSAGAVDYKLATAFEALVGYLYLKGEEERLKEIFQGSVNIVEEGNNIE